MSPDLLPADPALPALAAFPGATLVAHRPGRRAVVRTDDGHYVKVLRPGRTDRVATRLRTASALLDGRPGAPVVPRVDGQGDGWVRLDPLPGPSLHDLLRDDPAAAVALCRRAGPALAALQGVPVAAGTLPAHSVIDEVAVLDRAGASTAAIEEVAEGLFALGPRPLVACHRDLHDKQLLDGPDGSVGLIDLDTLCVADPALDVGNLLAHLFLRTWQGHCAPATATRCAVALQDGVGVGVGGVGAAALEAYRAAAFLRLAAVYAARPGRDELVAPLLSAARRA